MQTLAASQRVEQVTDLIDSGRFQLAEELINASDGLGEALSAVLQAEIKIYFVRLDEATELLEWVSERVAPHHLPYDVGARYALVRGELHYWRFEYEPAERCFLDAEGVYSFIKDHFGQAKALYNLGRLKRRTADFDAALRYLDQGLKLLEGEGERKGCDYLKALIAYNKAVCLDQLGQLEAATSLCSGAIADLKRTEHGRYYALALSSYGLLLGRLGRFEESLSTLNESIEILQGFAGFDDIACVLNNRALTLIRLGKFDQAENLLQESCQLYESAGNIEYVSAALQTFAELYLERGNAKQAEFYAQRAAEQGDLAKNDFEKAQALITLGQAKILQDDLEQARTVLENALEIGKKHRSRLIETAATIYLAETLCKSKPVQAVVFLEQGKALLNEYYDRHLMDEVERIFQRLNNGRVRVTEDNQFVMSGDFLPNWYEAKHAVEGFLIQNALQQADGNFSEAARMLGITPVHVRRYARKLSK